MPDSNAVDKPRLEVLFADHPKETVALDRSPFLVGRGRDNGNHLSLDDMRVSRRSAEFTSMAGSVVVLDDCGQREGIFVNGVQTKSRVLRDGDRIRLGLDDACQLIFHAAEASVETDTAEIKLKTLLEAVGDDSVEELEGLRLLLEATSLMHSQLPLEAVLSTMLDHAIVITKADRGMLLESDAAGVLQVKLARGKDEKVLEPGLMNPSRSVLNSAIETESVVINGDLNFAELNFQSAHSVIGQLLRSAVVLPLFGASDDDDDDEEEAPRRRLLGAIYLDSKRTATFSALDRQLLDALAGQAGSILENARLIQEVRERQRLEQELSIAREIQQGLVPQGSQEFPHFSTAGVLRPSNEVGGDYFDVFPMPENRLALLIADVAGKGLGAALVTTMLQGALSGMVLGIDPVKVFNHVNRFLCGRGSIGRCATMFFGVLHADGLLEFLRGGHPTPLLMRGGQVCELYTEGSLPIGLMEQQEYESACVQLQPGDTLLLYTDGVTEAEDNERNLFQEERLKEAFRKYGELPLNQLQNGIFSAIESFTGGASQSDDVTLLSVRFHGGATATATPKTKDRSTASRPVA